MKNEIIEVLGKDESLNYCVMIKGKEVALFRTLEDANYYIEKVMRIDIKTLLAVVDVLTEALNGTECKCGVMLKCDRCGALARVEEMGK